MLGRALIRDVDEADESDHLRITGLPGHPSPPDVETAFPGNSHCVRDIVGMMKAAQYTCAGVAESETLKNSRRGLH